MKSTAVVQAEACKRILLNLLTQRGYAIVVPNAEGQPDNIGATLLGFFEGAIPFIRYDGTTAIGLGEKERDELRAEMRQQWGQPAGRDEILGRIDVLIEDGIKRGITALATEAVTAEFSTLTDAMKKFYSAETITSLAPEVSRMAAAVADRMLAKYRSVPMPAAVATFVTAADQVRKEGFSFYDSTSERLPAPEPAPAARGGDPSFDRMGGETITLGAHESPCIALSAHRRIVLSQVRTTVEAMIAILERSEMGPRKLTFPEVVENVRGWHRQLYESDMPTGSVAAIDGI